MLNDIRTGLVEDTHGWMMDVQIAEPALVPSYEYLQRPLLRLFLLKIRFEHLHAWRRVNANHAVVIYFDSFDVGLANPFLDAVGSCFIERLVA